MGKDGGEAISRTSRESRSGFGWGEVSINRGRSAALTECGQVSRREEMLEREGKGRRLPLAIGAPDLVEAPKGKVGGKSTQAEAAMLFPLCDVFANAQYFRA